MGTRDYLFNEVDWHSVDQNQRQQMVAEINGMDAERLLNTPVDDLASYFAQKFGIDVPVLDEENISVDSRETRMDVSGDPMRYISDRGRPFYVAATEIAVEVPFAGEVEAFKIRPNPYTLNPPRAQAHGSIVRFSIVGTNLETDQVRRSVQAMVSEIQSYLNNLRSNAAGLNSALPGVARSTIEARRAKLLAGRNMAANLGFKMKERPDAPRTVVAPEVRRKIAATLPPASTVPFRPEPLLAPTDYEHILGVMQGMTQVMELSPSAFHDIGEEALRSHFLVQLNGHYQGQATGETFNYEGKTDILIRSDGRNIFIAECKFWSGPKMLVETIDQLLGYSSWRDTKTAIVLLNRNKDFSKVLAAIPDAVRTHPHFKRELPGSTETTFRYLFSHKDDPGRELFLTILAFDVPTLRSS